MHTSPNYAATTSNLTELTAVSSSKIVGIVLHPSRAEISRVFISFLKPGFNRISISGLPSAIVKDSIRVTGKGSATLLDIIVSADQPSTNSDVKSGALKEMLRKRTRIEKAILRCEESLLSYKTYLGTLDASRMGVENLSKYSEAYQEAASQLDDKILDLEDQLDQISAQIQDEESKALSVPSAEMLRTRVAIDLVTSCEAQVEILLEYTVTNCSWRPSYDVRLNTQTEDKVIAVTYKACISQNTAESWNNVPITLETADPTLSVDIPTLEPWSISFVRHVYPLCRTTPTRQGGIDARPYVPGVPTPPSLTRASINAIPKEPIEPLAQQATSDVSKGLLSAVFQPPGTITIPCDSAEHNVVLCELMLGAIMSWVSVPKANSKAYLKVCVMQESVIWLQYLITELMFFNGQAKITNTSEYPLLNGNANIFIDDSFTAVSKMPVASPDESFELGLGVDTSVRITYHPRSNKTQTIPPYSYRTPTTQTCEQRISVRNNKPIPIEIKVIDQIPISSETGINVKILKPLLTPPSATTAAKRPTSNAGPSQKSVAEAVKVADGVVARWEGPENQGADQEGLGKDGKVSWLCSLAPQAQANLVLRWEITSADGRHWYSY
ncbi:hypothetical protein H0H93_014605 [Arthromyces matolae]|nr:hypothetical protein H0H93_014605 [Arthromyces matolae]